MGQRIVSGARGTLDEGPEGEGGFLAGGLVEDVGDFRAHLIEGHHPEIYSFHFRLCRDVAVAEDRTHTTFHKALLGIRTFRLGTNLRTWLFGFAANVATDAGSAVEQVTRRPEDAEEEPAAPTAHGPAEPNEVRRAVDEGIAALPTNLGIAIVLKIFENLPDREIAQALDVSETLVRWRLWKARTLLRERLGECLRVGAFR
ncbi:MAG: RNA polymerase sigma factor [Planctomycetota bacterium]